MLLLLQSNFFLGRRPLFVIIFFSFLLCPFSPENQYSSLHQAKTVCSTNRHPLATWEPNFGLIAIACVWFWGVHFVPYYFFPDQPQGCFYRFFPGLLCPCLFLVLRQKETRGKEWVEWLWSEIWRKILTPWEKKIKSKKKNNNNK